MSILNRLPLDSPLWNNFNTLGIPAKQLPLILKSLIEGPIAPNHPALEKLESAIFHQYTLTEASYAAIPYLIDIHARYGKTNPGILFLAANIAASADVHSEAFQLSVRHAYLEALLEFEILTISKILTTGQPFDDVYNACQAALAFSRHCCGKLLMDVLEGQGTKRTMLVCPRCDKILNVILSENGLVIAKPEQVICLPEPPNPWTRPIIRSHSVRQLNPWKAVQLFIVHMPRSFESSDVELLHLELATQRCALGILPETSPEEVFSVIGCILLAHGFVESARRFFRMWDMIECPMCSSKFIAATGWWGCSFGPSMNRLKTTV